MFTRWHTIKRNTVSTLSRSTMENDNTSFYSDCSVPPTEAEGAGVAEAQVAAKTYCDAHSDRDVPQNGCPTALGSGQNNVACSGPTLFVSSPGALEEENAPAYESTGSAADNRNDCDPAVPVSTSPQRQSTHDGAQPVFLGQRPKNVILFGETGVGKSSVINLMAGKEVAKTSANLKGCTLQATEYWFGLSEEVTLRIFDTVGLEEPEIGVNTFMGAIEKAHKLIKSLHHSGGIDLLLFCIRGGRITAAMQRSYRLFFEILCGSQVPLAIVVTNLEQENIMEDWWIKNEQTFQQYGIHPTAHACITAVPAHVTMYAQKRAESQVVLRKMLLDTLSKPSQTSYLQEIRKWFASVIYLLRSFLMRTESLKKKDLMKRLEKRCMLPRSDAERLTQILTGEGIMIIDIDAVLPQQVCTGASGSSVV